MAVTLAEICDGIETTLGAASGISSSKSYDELTEGIPAMDCPRLQVHPARGGCDSPGKADRTTFQAGVQQTLVVVYADLYARLRSQLDEDMKATVDETDALIDVLQAQERPPFFGVAGIKAFRWEWKRATFSYAEERYMGARFTLNIRIF
jgi:hypothetical protein